MRFPQAPPSEAEMWAHLRNSPQRYAPIMQSVPGPTHRGKYIHWDELRHLRPPGDLSHMEWWFGLKMRRMGTGREIALKDRGGKPFQYSIVDPLPEELHRIDLSTGSQASMPEPVLDPATKDRFVARSLIEEAITSSQLEGAATTREIARDMIRVLLVDVEPGLLALGVRIHL
jgi:hypothetical protein